MMLAGDIHLRPHACRVCRPGYSAARNGGESDMRKLIVALMFGAAAPACAADYAVIELHADAKASVDAAWAKVGS
jgi:hypothetical protein